MTTQEHSKRHLPALSGNRSARKSRILTGTAIFLAISAFGAFGVVPLAPDAADLPVKMLSQELALPNIEEQLSRLQEQHYIREEKVRSGDSLASLLHRLGVDDAAAAEFIKNDKTAHAVMQLKSGKRVQAEMDADGELQWLRTTLGDNGKDATPKNLLIERKGEQFSATEVPAKLERRIEMATADIKSSLYAATDAAQIPEAIQKQIVEMFETNIDFRTDLRRGDHFTVVYESFWQDGEQVRTGRVLAGEFVNGHNTYKSVWFDDAGEQSAGYYTFDGKALKKAFLKSPLEFSRISSGFSMRVHPISGQWKQHKGVDFAAATGTPIRASADGTVDTIGGQSGYGNMITIKHWANYTTAYAHMSRFAPGIHRGSKVRQGDVIGYVGSTGWATGPHLHYEFRVNNTATDPMTIKVAAQQPLNNAEMARFQQVAADIGHRFELLRPGSNGQQLARLAAK